MEEQSVADKVSELEKRIAYLERELEKSYDQYQFEKKVESLFPGGPDHREIEFRDGNWGTFARVTGIDAEQVNEAIGRVENNGRGRYDNIDYSVTETSDGLGLEVYRGAAVGR